LPELVAAGNWISYIRLAGIFVVTHAYGSRVSIALIRLSVCLSVCPHVLSNQINKQANRQTSKNENIKSLGGVNCKNTKKNYAYT